MRVSCSIPQPKIPGKHPRLEGTGDTSRVLKIRSLEDANAARRDIERIVKAWCDWRDAGSPAHKSDTGKKKARALEGRASGNKQPRRPRAR